MSIVGYRQAQLDREEQREADKRGRGNTESLIVEEATRELLGDATPMEVDVALDPAYIPFSVELEDNADVPNLEEGQVTEDRVGTA